nr:hypothetical protein [Methanosarcina horonobensis]
MSHKYFGNREKAQPIIDWGKYHEKEGKFMMPFAARFIMHLLMVFILANLRISCRDTWMKCRL